LSLRFNSVRSTRDPTHSGIGPVDLLFSRSRIVSDKRSHIHSGIGPDKLFLKILRRSAYYKVWIPRDLSLRSPSGISALGSLFVSKLRSVSLVHSAKLTGIGPAERSPFAIANFVNSVIFPISDGSFPTVLKSLLRKVRQFYSYISVTLSVPFTQIIPTCVQHVVAEILGIPECRISQSVAASAVVKSKNATAIFMVLLYLSEIEESGRAKGKAKPLYVGEESPYRVFLSLKLGLLLE
jgi:hypothetical protein